MSTPTIKKLVLFVLLLLIASFTPIGSGATVFINEIAWMGTDNSSNDEWIELYNDDSQSVNLSGWKLTSKDGKLMINLLGNVSSSGFYLLERTDENTVPNIQSDQIYTGTLSNSGETLDLYDLSDKIIDYVDCSTGWFAGDNTTKKTMERKSYGYVSSDWATSINNGGTPKSTNSVLQISRIELDSKKNSVSDSLENEEKPMILAVYPRGIIINEFLPAPSGDDAENEWIELYNQNGEPINISRWQLKDGAGKSATFAFPENTFIGPHGFLLFYRKTTKIILNNDGDEISLIAPDGKIIDNINYTKAPVNQSYDRINNEWFWSRNLTPGNKNILPSPVPINDIVIKNNSIKTSEVKNNLASLESQIPKTFSRKPVSILLIAMGLALFSGTIILFIKKKLTK